MGLDNIPFIIYTYSMKGASAFQIKLKGIKK